MNIVVEKNRKCREAHNYIALNKISPLVIGRRRIAAMLKNVGFRAINPGRLAFRPIKRHLPLQRCFNIVNVSYNATSKRRYTSEAPKNDAQPKHKGKLLLLLGLLAVGSTVVSLSYQKNAPAEFLEEEQSVNKPQKIAQPAFSPKQVSVIFVLGGPGSGKGTQCAKLVKEYGFVHLSAGDLLRAEQARAGSQYGDLIKHYIKEGLIVPQEVTVALLQQAITENYKSGKSKFLVDGFPRKMDQAITFENQIVPSKFTLFFECPEKVMLERLLERGKTSGRSDDNIESIKKRFRTFIDTSMPVIEHFEKQSKVVTVRCDDPIETVYDHVQAAIKEKLQN